MATAAPGRSAGAPAPQPVFRDEPDIVAPNYPLLVIGVMLASMIQVLDTTITIVAVPHMQSALGAMRLQVLGAELNGVPVTAEHIYEFCIGALIHPGDRV